MTADNRQAVAGTAQRVRSASAVASVELLRAETVDGRVVLIAVSRSRPGHGYVLRRDARGRWHCGCAGYRWRGGCSHSEAAEAEWPVIQRAR